MLKGSKHNPFSSLLLKHWFNNLGKQATDKMTSFSIRKMRNLTHNNDEQALTQSFIGHRLPRC